MLLLCLFWLTFPFYLNAQDDCSVFHEGACPLEVHLFFRLIVIAIIVVCKSQIFYKELSRDCCSKWWTLWKSHLLRLYFGIFQLSMFIVISICNVVMAEWGDNFENIFIIIQVSLSLEVDLVFFRLIVIVIPSWKHFLPLSLYRCQTSWMTAVSH